MPARMTLVPFAMERWRSTWEPSVAINRSGSGVEPLPLWELLLNGGAIERSA